MSCFLRSCSKSRSIHEEYQFEPARCKTNRDDACTTLTVWRKSLMMNCNGFTVFGSGGELVYRVDNYNRGRYDELILMDGSGVCVFTLLRSKNFFKTSWGVYEGETDAKSYGGTSVTRKKSSSEPIMYIREYFNMNISFCKNTDSVLAYLYRRKSDTRYAYIIKGSYKFRSCKVVDHSNKVVAEIKRKEDGVKGISLGLEVFVLDVDPEFDHGLAMALVLVLDQIFF